MHGNLHVVILSYIDDTKKIFICTNMLIATTACE